MSKVQVLLYHDRKVFDRNRVWLSPLYTVVSYFRTLNVLQLISWFLWLVILAILRSGLIRRKGHGFSLSTIQILSLASTVFLLINGTVLNLKARSLTSYNDIYNEYGNIMLLCGSGFLAYTLTLVFFEYKRKRPKKILR